MKITAIKARQILDSRGNPTVEADVVLENGVVGRAAVPSGASTGMHEAIELRDGDKTMFLGRGVLKAVSNVNGAISKAVVGLEVTDQKAIDLTMITLDGTENKSNIGANAILAVSLASAKAAALSTRIPLYAYIGKLAGNDKFVLPLPMINIINGGKHADWATDIQETIVFPVGADTFSKAIQMGAELFQVLGKVIKTHGYAVTVGDEGGYAPLVKRGNTEPLDLITEAVSIAGYEMGKDFVFGLDGAASEFFKDGKYHLQKEGKILNSEEMVEWLVDLSSKYPIVSMEDCLDQEDWNAWVSLTTKLGNKIQIIGDDLLVTNTKFLAKGIDLKACNAILIKVNQIGTLTETIAAVQMAQKAGWKAIISHRSGETEDTTIADLIVGLGTGQIKAGSLSRSDRVAKYNQLLRIEEELGEKAIFAGKDALRR